MGKGVAVTVTCGAVALTVFAAGNGVASEALAAIVIGGSLVLVGLVALLAFLVCHRVKRHVLTTWPRPGITRVRADVLRPAAPASGPERPATAIRPVVRGEVLAAPERPATAPLALRPGRH